MRITLKLMLILALMSTPAIAGNLFVPYQHPTIQAAVEVASPGDRILVGEGVYDGAFITKWVKISGEGDQTVITHGPNNRVGSFWFQNGFRLEAGAEGTSISDLSIGLIPLLGIEPQYEQVQRGIFGLGVDKVKISNIKFIGPGRGIDVRSGDKWHITNNTIEGLRAQQRRPWQAIGIGLLESSDSFVGFNTITHNGSPDGIDKIFRGIDLSCRACLEPSDNNKLIQNEVAINATDPRFINDINLFDGAARDGAPVSLFNNKIIQNKVESMRFAPPELVEYNVIE